MLYEVITTEWHSLETGTRSDHRPMTAETIDRLEDESEFTPFRRGMILATITLSQTIYGMTFLMVAVVLPQIRNNFV